MITTSLILIIIIFLPIITFFICSFIKEEVDYTSTMIKNNPFNLKRDLNNLKSKIENKLIYYKISFWLSILLLIFLFKKYYYFKNYLVILSFLALILNIYLSLKTHIILRLILIKMKKDNV